MLYLGKQTSSYSTFKIVHGIPIPSNLSIDAPEVFNNSLQNYFYSILLTSFIGCGLSVLAVVFYCISTSNFNLYSITIVMLLSPLIMFSAIVYHHLYKLFIKISANKSIGYVVAIDSAKEVLGETVFKRALICLVLDKELYLLMSYNSSVDISIGEMVQISWRKNNSKLCWIHSVVDFKE